MGVLERAHTSRVRMQWEAWKELMLLMLEMPWDLAKELIVAAR